MADITVAAGYPLRPHTADYSLHIVKGTGVTNGLTYTVPGGKTILGVQTLECSTNVIVTYTVSGRVVTIGISAGNPDVKFAVLLQ